MRHFNNEKGFSLIEVVAAMALLFIVFIVSTQMVMNTMTQSETINQDFTAMEIADGIMSVYKAEPSGDLEKQINSDVIVDVPDLLQIDDPKSVAAYQARVKVTNPDDLTLKSQLLKITVTVETSTQTSRLEGYVEL
ncbi:prepilin-type N-terminal cleavage/methylation domain-containing protein [Halobacillus litoralis]|uniref:type IV pilus modification PilV family protein n=1 Tax=Halobacillus litoralis TaxID=45668 RepID=UPI001CFC716C|nr:prepilin-type N-terminal cleavage/methylation domain-containing protein [Halobacillus litoralis]